MASAADRLNTKGLSGPTWADLSSGQPRASTSNREVPSIGSGVEDEPDEHNVPTAAVTPDSVTTPPYWTASKRLHQRNVSADSLPAGAIMLRDNEDVEDDDRNNACWAKSVEIIDHTVVNSNATNIGAFVVWIIKVETLNVSIPKQRAGETGRDC